MSSSQTDIEIYTKALSFDQIHLWLDSRFGAVTVLNSGKVVHDLQVTHEGHTIDVMVVEQAVGKPWTSIWFKSEQTPWSDDMACARDINAALHCRVRCNAGHWQEGGDMDEWWQLDEKGGESFIAWPNAG